MWLSSGEGVVPEPEDQVQAAEAGGGGSWQPAEEKGKPPHQQMAHRHEAIQLRGHRRDFGRLKPPHVPLWCTRGPKLFIMLRSLSVIRHVRGGLKVISARIFVDSLTVTQEKHLNVCGWWGGGGRPERLRQRENSTSFTVLFLLYIKGRNEGFWKDKPNYLF